MSEYDFLDDLQNRLVELEEKQKTLGAEWRRVQAEFQENGMVIQSLKLVIKGVKEERGTQQICE